MNGRVYDPKLGRMLSPDPVIQAPENGQNYNRYTYAYNNPLKYTDPSGNQNTLLACTGDSCDAVMEEVKVGPSEPRRPPEPSGGAVIGNQAALAHAGNGGSNNSPQSEPGDRVEDSGQPVSDIQAAGKIDCTKTPGLCTRAELNQPEPQKNRVPFDTFFWKNISDRASAGSVASGGLTLVCPECAPVTIPVALWFTGISIVTDLLSGSGVEDSLNGGVAPLVETVAGAAMGIHPVIKATPKQIRDKISGALGLAIGSAEVSSRIAYD